MKAVAWLALCCVAAVQAKVYFEEKFDDKWADRWQSSDWKRDKGEAGDWQHTAGEWYGDAEADKGIQTSPDHRFHTIWAEMPEEVDNTGKDLVVQFSVKHAQKMDCGGGYIKLIPTSSKDQMKTFGGETRYAIMFGPDICGFSTQKVHAILTDNKGRNLETKKATTCKTDELTHVYTLHLMPNNTYRILIDNEEAAKGALHEDWDFEAPKQIKDPEAKKPEDWDDRIMIEDPEDKKPEGYDDIPATIVDAEAKRPEDWDDEEDGVWEAPQLPNPDFKGPWSPNKITNPAYKGAWEAPMIDNPEYEHIPNVYKLPLLKFVGFELWQVKSGTIFDNVLVTDDAHYAEAFANATWGASKEKEMEMFNAIAKKKADEAEAKRKEEEAAREAAKGEEKDEDGDSLPQDFEALSRSVISDEEEEDEAHAEL
ncbi:hypothetical protein WJX81_001639 [Elliptochloris bilobata]|uniref:Calreticulin n=1 Tax=Elliptochloris bilobata TaxID=381761 RepID=A0AAW1REE9_9CHLO